MAFRILDDRGRGSNLLTTGTAEYGTHKVSSSGEIGMETWRSIATIGRRELSRRTPRSSKLQCFHPANHVFHKHNTRFESRRAQGKERNNIFA